MTTWDGTERRKEYGRHMEMLPECVQVFKRVEEKIDELVSNTRAINGRYQKHLEDAIPYRSKVDEIDKSIIESKLIRRQMMGAFGGIIFAIVAQIVTFAVLWGGLTKQVEINTDRWNRLLNGQEIHEVIQNGNRSSGVQ